MGKFSDLSVFNVHVLRGMLDWVLKIPVSQAFLLSSRSQIPCLSELVSCMISVMMIL